MEKPNCSMYDYMLDHNKKYMNYIALSFGNLKITYEEMHQRIDEYVKLLYSKGIRNGDVIGIIALNCPESVYLLYALNKIGAVTVGLSPLDNADKIKKDIELTRPKIIISVDMCYGNIKNFQKSLNFSTILYSPVESLDNKKIKSLYTFSQLSKGNFKLDSNSNLRSLLKKKYLDIEDDKLVYDSSSLTDVLFTGGSTGVHKGVDLAGSGLNYVVEGMNSIFSAEAGMIHLGNIPIGHMAYGRMIMHYALSNNMELALTLKALPSDFYDELVRTHANAAVGGPPHWVSLIEQDGNGFTVNSKLKKGSLSELHYATSGGEAKKRTTVDAINNALKYCGSDAVIGDGLGATETWASIMINNGKIHTIGTIGEPISTLDVKLVDKESGKEVKTGENGLLYVSGPSIMLGYHNNPEETNKVISYDDNGKRWINVGDVLKKENKEYIYIGRDKRNFVSGIENIYPEQLENALLSLPEIREVVVTPIPDEMVQFIPRYHISLYDKKIDIDKFEKKLTSFVSSKFGINWLPGTIKYYFEPLKRMGNSKIDISYYRQQDSLEFDGGTINQEEAKILRMKKI
ncbi:MAG: class I adenylate-forming enzyme family protein [Bacilli bacterium]